MTSFYQAELLVDCGNALGEGLVWNASEQRIYWTDIFGNTVFSCREDGSEILNYETDEPVTAFSFADDGRILAAFASGLFWADRYFTKTELVRRYHPDQPNVRMNDGNTDRDGRFIVGGINENDMEQTTSVWQYFDDKIESIIDGVGCANSTCFSPEGDRFYFADSVTRRIDVRDYDTKTGEVGEKHVFAYLEDHEGVPDGSTIDVHGNLWNAQFGGGAVQGYSPDGKKIERVLLPIPNVTCCAIGGANLDTMFITSARLAMSEEQLSAHPSAGGLYVVNSFHKGIAPTLFKSNSLRA